MDVADRDQFGARPDRGADHQVAAFGHDLLPRPVCHSFCIVEFCACDQVPDRLFSFPKDDGIRVEFSQHNIRVG